MTLVSVWEWVCAHAETIAVILGIVAGFLKALANQKLTADQALLLIANALQDEKKMTNGQFTTATITKIDTVAQASGADPAVVDIAKQTITKINQAVTQAQPVTPTAPALSTAGANDIKIGSMNGRPIYLGQVVGISAQAKAVMEVFGRIFGRK